MSRLASLWLTGALAALVVCGLAGEAAGAGSAKRENCGTYPSSLSELFDLH